MSTLEIVELDAHDGAAFDRHMIEVNGWLGFIPVARLGEFQKRT